MFGLSFWEITLILAVALLVLGPKRLPGLAKSVGKGLRELRRASSDLRSAIEEPLEEVRKPLEDIRGDLVDTVQGFGDEVEREAAAEDAAADTADEHDPYEEEQPDGEEQLEVDDRRREVEQMYSDASATDEAEEALPTPPVDTKVKGASDEELSSTEGSETGQEPKA